MKTSEFLRAVCARVKPEDPYLCHVAAEYSGTDGMERMQAILRDHGWDGYGAAFWKTEDSEPWDQVAIDVIVRIVWCLLVARDYELRGD